MIHGNCLCGNVRFGIDGPFERMSHCHCSMCRKVHGSAFATYAAAPAARLHWLDGEDAGVHYSSSENFVRSFCGTCGAVVPEFHGENVVVPVGNLDDDPGLSPQCHIFVGSQAPWHVIGDDPPRYECWDEGEPLAGPPSRPACTGTGEGVSGSCLCGKVAFEVTEPLRRAHNCHCSRCRRGRSAAHASNAFTSIDGVRFLRGEDAIKVYKLPEAR